MSLGLPSSVISTVSFRFPQTYDSATKNGIWAGVDDSHTVSVDGGNFDDNSSSRAELLVGSGRYTRSHRIGSVQVPGWSLMKRASSPSNGRYIVRVQWNFLFAGLQRLRGDLKQRGLTATRLCVQQDDCVKCGQYMARMLPPDKKERTLSSQSSRSCRVFQQQRCLIATRLCTRASIRFRKAP
jgi:hypothetical protein